MPSPDSKFSATLHLVEAAQSGSKQATEDLFARYLPIVERIVSLRMGWKLRRFMDYEDLAQESLLAVFQSLDSFQHRSEGSFRNWVATCVERRIVDTVRKVDARRRGEGNELRFRDCRTELFLSSILAGRSPTPSSIAAQREMEERVEEAILSLKPHLREVIVQRHLCGLTYVEIARNMNLDESSIRYACTRAERTTLARIESGSR